MSVRSRPGTRGHAVDRWFRRPDRGLPGIVRRDARSGRDLHPLETGSSSTGPSSVTNSSAPNTTVGSGWPTEARPSTHHRGLATYEVQTLTRTESGPVRPESGLGVDSGRATHQSTVGTPLGVSLRLV